LSYGRTDARTNSPQSPAPSNEKIAAVVSQKRSRSSFCAVADNLADQRAEVRLVSKEKAARWISSS